MTFSSAPLPYVRFHAFRPPFTPEQEIIAEVARAHRVSIADIMGRLRLRKIARARQEVYYRLSRRPGATLSGIGRRMGRNHATIGHGIKAHLAANPGLPRPFYFDNPNGRHIGGRT